MYLLHGEMIPLNDTLQTMRNLYGDTHQLTVCIEELAELACVLCKYPRYSDSDSAVTELHDKVLDEYADVNIVLQYVKEIFNLTDEEIDKRIQGKINRMQRWVDSGNPTPEQTLKDREVIE